MMTMYPNVPFRRVNPDAPTPTYAHEGDAGMDLCATEDVTLLPGEWQKVGSGIACAIPKGFVGLVVPRSGMGCKGLVLKNGIGVIDSTYRGEISMPLLNNNPTHVYFPSDDTMGGGYECYEENFDAIIHIHKGDRVAQLLIVPVAQANMVESDTLNDTERGEGGFGSTGTSITRGPRV